MGEKLAYWPRTRTRESKRRGLQVRIFSQKGSIQMRESSVAKISSLSLYDANLKAPVPIHFPAPQRSNQSESRSSMQSGGGMSPAKLQMTGITLKWQPGSIVHRGMSACMHVAAFAYQPQAGGLHPGCIGVCGGWLPRSASGTAMAGAAITVVMPTTHQGLM
jgi:hypothetical protein